MTATRPARRASFGFAGAIALTLTAALTTSLTTTAPAVSSRGVDTATARASWTMIFNDEFSGGPHPDATLWMHGNPPKGYRTTCRRNGSHTDFKRNRDTSNNVRRREHAERDRAGDPVRSCQRPFRPGTAAASSS
jgi:hypothetical protein